MLLHQVIKAVGTTVGADGEAGCYISIHIYHIAMVKERRDQPCSFNTLKAFSLMGWFRTSRANGAGGLSVRKN